MPLRKVLVRVAGQGSNNMGSFTNVTSKRLHMIMLDLNFRIIATIVALDNAAMSVDEVTTAQRNTNDSRAHIMGLAQIVGDATGAGLATTNPAMKILRFNRNELVLDRDESLFMNGQDVVGGATFESWLNIWYDD